MTRLLALLTAGLLALGLSGPAGPGAAATPEPAARGERTTYRPTPVPLSAQEIANPMRGIYFWLGVPVTPKGWPWRDVYARDAVNWEDIEPSPGSYDLTAFREGLRQAGKRRGRFGFRVMAYCPGCGDDVAPAYLPRQGDTGVIAWNDERVLAAWERLMAAIGAELADDPRLGWVDVGGYGSWGEWHPYGLPKGTGEISDASALRFIDGVLNAFPDTQVVFNVADTHNTTLATSHSARLGLRADCLGEGRWPLVPDVPQVRRRWRTQPVVTEWCNFDDTRMAIGLRQVRRFHVSMVSSGNFPVPYAHQSPAERAAYRMAAKRSGYRYLLRRVGVPSTWRPGGTATVTVRLRNAGSAPTYDPWQVSLQWRRRGRVAAEAPLAIDLRRALPGRHRYRLRVAVPDTLDGGRYDLAVVIRDPSGYLPPLRLANRGRLRDGSYPLG